MCVGYSDSMTSATDAQREYHNLTTLLDPDGEKNPYY